MSLMNMNKMLVFFLVVTTQFTFAVAEEVHQAVKSQKSNRQDANTSSLYSKGAAFQRRSVTGNDEVKVLPENGICSKLNVCRLRA